MKVEKRMCLKTETFVDGDESFTLERGKEYTVSPPRGDGTVTVFARYWFNAKESLFEPRREAGVPGGPQA